MHHFEFCDLFKTSVMMKDIITCEWYTFTLASGLFDVKRMMAGPLFNSVDSSKLFVSDGSNQ